MDVAWPKSGPVPGFLDDAMVVAGFAVVVAVAVREPNETRAQHIFDVAWNSAPCDLDAAPSERLAERIQKLCDEYDPASCSPDS